MYVEVFFLLWLNFSESTWKGKRKREKERERSPRANVKTRQRILNVSHTRLYANHMSCVCVGKSVRVCVYPCPSSRVSLFLHDTVQLTDTCSCVGVYLYAHGLSLCCVSLRMLQMQSVRACMCACVHAVSVRYCVILQIRKTCRWVKSH